MYPPLTRIGQIPEYRITALRQGWLEVDRSTQTYLHGFGESLWVPVWAYLVRGEGIPNILIDTGMFDPAWISEFVSPCRQTDSETITGSLATIGLTPDDIDVVINTHLHYDHSDNNPVFPHARFFVSRAEWDSALDPPELQTDIYNGRWLHGDLTPFHYTLIDSKYFDVAPGIRVMQTPGHCTGVQTVLINTAEGVAAVCGDTMNTPENIRLNAPPGIVLDAQAALESIHRIVAVADVVLTGHDPGLEHGQSSDFPRVSDYLPSTRNVGSPVDDRSIIAVGGPA